MNINIKVNDVELGHPKLGMVPAVELGLVNDEDVSGLSEPTPAMWTAACIYALHISGKLNQLTADFIASHQTEKSEEVAGG